MKSSHSSPAIKAQAWGSFNLVVVNSHFPSSVVLFVISRVVNKGESRILSHNVIPSGSMWDLNATCDKPRTGMQTKAARKVFCLWRSAFYTYVSVIRWNLAGRKTFLSISLSSCACESRNFKYCASFTGQFMMMACVTTHESLLPKACLAVVKEKWGMALFPSFIMGELSPMAWCYLRRTSLGTNTWDKASCNSMV